MAFGSGATRTLGLKLEADVSDAASKLNSVDGKLDGFKSMLKGMGGAIAAGFATDKILEFGKATIDAASDTNESMNKVQTVFGDSAKSMEDFIRQANNIGLSDQVAANFAGTLGNMFNQLGFGSGQAADMSKSMITLAADLGSFNNLPTADVLDSMNSAFRGEYDSLQRVIPTINAAAVAQKAMAMTGKTSADQLTDQEKAAATYQLVMDGAGAAQGDFAKTSDGLANQQKVLGSKFDDVKTSIGNELLPILTTMGSWILDTGIPAFEKFVEGLKKVGDWIGDNMDVIEAIGIALGVVGGIILASLVPAFIAWATAAGAAAIATLAAAAPFIVIGAAIAALAYLIIHNWDTIVAATKAAWGWVKDAIDVAWNGIKAGASAVWDFLKSLWNGIEAVLTWPFKQAWNGIKWVWDKIKAGAGEVKDFVKGVFSGLASAITAPIKIAWNALASVWNNTVGKISIKIPDFVPGLGGKGFNVPNLPKLAKGGIVTGPTLALLGEAGPEKVVPLSRENGNSRPVIINVQAGVGDPVEIGRQVASYLSAFEGIAGPQYAKPA